MEEFLTDPGRTKVQAHTKQVGWTSNLEYAKALLYGLTAEPPEGDVDAFKSAEGYALA